MTRLAVLVLLLAGCGVDTAPKATETLMQDTRTFRARLEIPSLVNVLEQWHQMHGKWPEAWEDLSRRPYDPWGALYVFKIVDDRPDVWSIGPDGEPGTGDEVRALPE